METLTINIPEEVEVKTVKAVLKALGVSVSKSAKGKKKGELYNPEFVAKIKQGEKDLAEGRYTIMKLEDIWK